MNVSARIALSPFEEAFVREMIVGDCTPREACRRAGYAESCLPTVSAALQQRADIVDAINDGRRAARAEIGRQTGLDLSQVVAMLAKMAAYDIADIYDDDGNVKPIHEIPEHARVAIESIDAEEVYEGRGTDRQQVATIRKVRMAKRGESLDKLMKHLGGYEKDNQQQMEPLTQLLTELAARGNNALKISREQT